MVTFSEMNDPGYCCGVKTESPRVYAHVEQHDMTRAITRLLKRKHDKLLIDTLRPLLEKFPDDTLQALADAVEAETLVRSKT